MKKEACFIEKIPVKTIKKIEDDIEKNDLGKARDRLHGVTFFMGMKYIFIDKRTLKG